MFNVSMIVFASKAACAKSNIKVDDWVSLSRAAAKLAVSRAQANSR